MGEAARPFYFRSGRDALFAWLHPVPLQCVAPLGLVICKPFGYEALCAHRSLRAWAQAAAATGVPALRFDYAGTGDSADTDAQAELLRVWTRDIAAAAGELRRRCGVGRVCLLGMRLGALAASLAASEYGGIDALIAIAPPSSGRRYLRELRALQGSLAPTTRAAAADPAEPLHAGDLEVTGFSLPCATVARLSALTPSAAPGTSAASSAVRDVLIIDRDDLPQASRWAPAWSSCGARVRYLALPGYSEMMSRPHTSVVPQAMLAACTQWLGALAAAPAAAVAPAGAAAAAPGVAAQPLEAGSQTIGLQVDGAQVLERALYIDCGRVLFAVADEPAGATGADRCQAAPQGASQGVILLNAGATSHVGPNRMYVGLARRWAACGYIVLRMDLAGLGDSETRAGRPTNQVYPPGALADVRLAVQLMRARYGVDELTLAGLCSGAYHCLRAAASGAAVQRLLLINPLTYFWKEGMTLSDLQDAEVLRGPSIYRARLRSGHSWRKLLTGRVDLRPIARTLSQRSWLALDSARRELARRARVHLADDLGWELEALCARGVRVVFLFARGDPGAALLQLQAGSSLRRLAGRCRLHYIDGADHVFSQSGPRAQLERVLERELMSVANRGALALTPLGSAQLTGP